MPRKRSNSSEPAPRRLLSIPELDEARLNAESYFAPYIPEPPTIVTNKGGRPTAYRREFRQTVLDQAALGHTIGATAALIGVTRPTPLDWASVDPEFAEALALAKGAQQPLLRRPPH
jgi:hypothetical protein